jgi:hypothetical protein
MWWRVSAWPPSQSPDAWAYIAWGQGLARGERPLYDHALTTPKPLGFLVGFVVSPVTPQHAFLAAVLVSLAAGAAALFWAAFRVGGTAGAVVAVGALGVSSVVGASLLDALIDGIAAALIMVAIAARGRPRLIALLLVGLGRPEAWILSGVAGYAESTGSVRRRLAVGGTWAAAAPAVWVAIDLAFTGDPLASTHRGREIIDITRAGHTAALASLPRLTADGVVASVGLAAGLLGTVGLAVMAVRGLRSRAFDPLPAAVIIGWCLGIAAETGSVPFKGRFLYPMAGALLLGLAYLAGMAVPRRLWGSALLAAVAASAVFAVGTGTMRTPSSRLPDLLRAMPTIERALECGHLRVTGRTVGIPGHRPASVTPVLAALTRRGLRWFEIGPGSRPTPAWFILGTGPPPAGWASRRFPFGTVAVDQACESRLGRL